MILELDIPAQDTGHGPVSDNVTLFLKVTAVRVTPKQRTTYYYVDMPYLPPEEAVEEVGTAIEAFFRPDDRTLRIGWNQVEADETFSTGVALNVIRFKCHEEFPAPTQA